MVSLMSKSNTRKTGLMRHAVCPLSGYSAVFAILTSMLFGGQAINFRQKMRVGGNSAAGVLFIDDTQLSLGAQTTIVVDEFVYKPDRSVVRGFMGLWGRLAEGVGELKIKPPIGSIDIRRTVFDALTTASGLEIALHEGSF